MPDLKTHIREKSPHEGEFIFEQWAKYLNLNLVEHDILHDFGFESEKVENVTAEKLRCVFAQGYRFAMLQFLQQSKSIYYIAGDDPMDRNDINKLITLLESQRQFIQEKIEDSFLLNRADGIKGRIISRHLKSEFKEHIHRDFLNW